MSKKGAGILLRSSDNKFLIGQRANYMKTFPGVWTVFGGTVEEGESFKDAAIREVREETGYKGKISNIELLFESEEPGSGFVFQTFLGDVDKEFIPKLTGEHRKAGWFALDKFPARLHPGFRDLVQDLKRRMTKDGNSLTEAKGNFGKNRVEHLTEYGLFKQLQKRIENNRGSFTLDDLVKEVQDRQLEKEHKFAELLSKIKKESLKPYSFEAIK